MASPENQIGIFLLGVGHAVVQRPKRGSELSDAIRMGVGDLAIGLQIVDSAHVVGISGSLLSQRVHSARIVAHHLRDLLPKFFLGCGDLKPYVKVIDARFDLVVDRNGHDACRCLSLCWRGSARRIGEYRYREKNRYRESNSSARLGLGWVCNEFHNRSPNGFDGLPEGIAVIAGELDRTGHLCADSQSASVRCRTLARPGKRLIRPTYGQYLSAFRINRSDAVHRISVVIFTWAQQYLF